MNLVPVSIDSILLNHPLPCALRDESGVLLAGPGFLVSSRQDLEVMIGKRNQIYIDADQSESFRRGYMSRLNNLVMEDRDLGQIAQAQVSPYDLKREDEPEASDEPDWLELQTQIHTVLRNLQAELFAPRLRRLQTELERQALRNPDGTLFALIHLACSELQHYSATHAMLVCVMSTLAARDVLKWNSQEVSSLGSASLTMNIGMVDLQDLLAKQRTPLTLDQRRRVDSHPARSVDLLQQMGISDNHWLEAVLFHHGQVPGPLGPRTVGRKLARLIQRADMFAARLAPRASREAESPALAMQACYFDENKEIDEAGAAIIKTVGIYSPGTYVRLSTNEIAVVVKRGQNTTTPKVAVLINRQGMPTGEPILRDTSLAGYRIVASIPQRDVKVNHNLERLLALTKPSMSDRIW